MNYTPSWLNNVHVFVGCFCYREGSISFTSFTQWTSLFSVKTGPLSQLNLYLMELLIVYFSEQSIKYQMRIKRTLPLCNSYDDISKISILLFYFWILIFRILFICYFRRRFNSSSTYPLYMRGKRLTGRR